MLADALSGQPTVAATRTSNLHAAGVRAAGAALERGAHLSAVRRDSTRDAEGTQARYPSAQAMLRDLEAVVPASQPIAHQPTGIATHGQTPFIHPPLQPTMTTPPAMAATQHTLPSQARTSPLVWIFGALGALAIVGIIVVAVVAIAIRPTASQPAAAEEPDGRGLAALTEQQARERIEKAGYKIVDYQHPISAGYVGMIFTVTKLPHAGSITISTMTEATAKYSVE
jgi:hypothetical protein